MNLLDIVKQKNLERNEPLAQRLKPRTLDEFIGQEHLIGDGKLLSRLILSDKVTSMIFHGGSGTGKTSLARIIANSTNSAFKKINAVTSGVKDIREVITEAEELLRFESVRTILFIDEIHRFNRSQQDLLLPYVENGTLTLIGATTENPYYEVNNALLSRVIVFELKDLKTEDIVKIIKNALNDERGLKGYNIKITDEAMEFLASRVSGDARKALNTLELAFLSHSSDIDIVIDKGIITECLYSNSIKYDKSADNHYDTVSAFIKSMRGSDVDASLHYLARMLVAGEDIKFIARRIVICASEDVGNADPNALVIAMNAANAVQFIGMPEARIILSQAVVYIANAPKSNASYIAIDKAIEDIKSKDIGEIPSYLKDMSANNIRSKHTDENPSNNYKYPHNYSGNYIEQQYLPDSLKGVKYYIPSGNGKEKQ